MASAPLHDPFPRVSARAHVRVARTPARPPTPVERLRRTLSDPWKTWTAAGTLALSGVLAAVMSQGVRTNAEAADMTTRELVGVIPAHAERVVIGADGGLRRALERAGVAPGDVDRVTAEAERLAPGARYAPGTPLDVRVGARAQISEYREIDALTLRPRMDMMIDFARDEGQLVATTRSVAVDTTPLRITGRFGGDVRQSLAAYGLGRDAIDEYVRIIGRQMSIADIARGDGFDVVVENAAAATGERISGSVMYAGLHQQNGNRLRMSEWTVRGRLAWYDADKASRSIDNVQRPVAGEVTSSYGWRFHPVLHFSRMHKGMDFHAGVGTPILAVQTGWVERAGRAGGYGNQVMLQHGGGVETSYSHLSRVDVAPGQLVRQGDVIGLAGATGLATGPHLHFEVHVHGASIDPARVAFTVGPQLRGRDLEGYQRRLDALLSVPVARAAVGA